MNKVKFGSLFQIPLRNGVYVKSDLHGVGTKIINMGELFSFPFISNQPMSRVQLSESEKATSLLEDGDLLFGRRSLVESGAGKCAIIMNPSEALTFESSLIRVRLEKSKAYPLFYYYWFKSPIGRATIHTLVTGSNVKGIKGSELKEIEVDYPLLELQKKIANALFLFDTKLKINNTISAQLESLAKTIYDYWFLQFEFPNEEGKPYKSSGGKMVWNEELKREIPEGWEVKKVKDCICHINTGLNPRQNFVLGNGDIKYVTVKNLTTNGNIDWTGCDTIDESAREKIHRRSDISKGDILFASIAPLGRCALIKETPNDWDINESVFSIRPNINEISTEYLYMLLTSNEFIKKAEHSSTGSIFAGIRISILENIPMLIPDNNILLKFSKIISELLSCKDETNKENRQLTSLRDFLLPLLMNGQVAFKDETASEEE